MCPWLRCRYGVVSHTRGVLYLCTTLIVLDTEERRYTIPYTEVTGLKREKDWKGSHWVQVRGVGSADRGMQLTKRVHWTFSHGCHRD